MKAIINIKTGGGIYQSFNGLTFEVKSLYQTGLSLHKIVPTKPTQAVCFAFNEVIIVDIQNELQEARNLFDWGNDSSDYQALLKY